MYSFSQDEKVKAIAILLLINEINKLNITDKNEIIKYFNNNINDCINYVYNNRNQF